MNPIIKELEKSYLKEEIADVNPGDTVKVLESLKVIKKELRLLKVLLSKNTVLA